MPPNTEITSHKEQDDKSKTLIMCMFIIKVKAVVICPKLLSCFSSFFIISSLDFCAGTHSGVPALISKSQQPKMANL